MTTARPVPSAVTIRRLFAVIAVGIALAGCSKCQDWRFYEAADASLDACKSDTVPQPQQ